MEIVVEIGSDEQKAQIVEELKFIELVTEGGDRPISFTQVIVAADFDETVQRLEGKENYRSNRGLGTNKLSAAARVTKDGDGYALVISPAVYTQGYDTQTRIFVFLHEIAHLMNKRDFPVLGPDETAGDTYRLNLYRFYDEYYADRFAYDLIEKNFLSKSVHWEAHLQNALTFYAGIACDPCYYDNAQKAIQDFFSGTIDLDTFLERTRVGFDEVSTSIAHLFSLVHSYPDILTDHSGFASHFINDHTFALVDYLDQQYEENSADVDDGIDLMADYMATFGVRFSDRGDQLYCNVHEI